jgi:Spy/CpxP family protein refolding chaperone
MNGRTWMIGALCAVALPLAALAQVGEGPSHFRGNFRGAESALLSGVTLSGDQQTAIKTIHQNARAANKPVFEQLRAIETQIHTALLAPGSVNTSALNSLQAQASALRTQLDAARLATEVQVRNILTPDQLATAAATGAQLKALHQQMRELTHPTTDSTTVQ